MPLKLLLDENLRITSVWHAIQRAQAATPLDIVRVGDAGCLPLGSTDDEIIRWSAEQGRIVVSRDLRTLSHLLLEWIEQNHHHPGVILLRPGLSAPEIVDIVQTVAYASDAADWSDNFRWLP